METYTGTVTRPFADKGKTLYGTITIESKELPLVCFKSKQDIEALEVLKSIKVEDIITFVGRKNFNPQGNKLELLLDSLSKIGDISHEEPYISYEEAMAMPTKDLVPLYERKLDNTKYTFPNGTSFYSDGLELWTEKNGPQRKLTHQFIEEYNNQVTMDKWLLPDWYSSETVKKVMRDLAILANKSLRN